ncbi:MAG TPA: hypothetical protein VE377_13215 [Candidatus Dormibacteraeota bacterium]|nr:hypothetical protein [Candidatus Dormibacteraeota bacterium]
MNEDNVLRQQRHRSGAERPAQPVQYTSKDFQLEVLDRLEEMRGLAESLEASWSKDAEVGKGQQRLSRFDGRTLVAIGAIGLSITGYVLQDARNSSKRDAEIETTRARVLRLEQIATTNSEARIRTEVQLGELRDGQSEIKSMIQAHDSGNRKGPIKK